MKLNRLFVALLLLAVMASCKKDEPYNDGVTVTAKNLYNVAYGPDGKQTMDIYLPAGRRSDSTKVMILIHGGGWTTGDKIDLNSYVDSFKKRLPEYAFLISITGYRLAAQPMFFQHRKMIYALP
ncbi:MAG: hypothetical protein IPP48_06585 [Chitinophagaceae bacterium]|nr:hypothetical protein [Chitinophagaceae bacterium]